MSESFVEEYLASWTGTDENKILAYYSDDIVLHVPTGTLEGKTAVRDNFVRPFITAFPGHVNVILNLAYGKNLVAVEWSFEGVHTGPLGTLRQQANRFRFRAAHSTTYDLATRLIPAGRSYFDFATLLARMVKIFIANTTNRSRTPCNSPSSAMRTDVRPLNS